MHSEFDTVINRRGTKSLKYDFAAARGMPENALPLWLADMDFRAPEGVREALNARIEHGIFGYTEVDPNYIQAVQDWFDTHFGWRPAAESLVVTPGVVFALAMAIRAYSRPGDGILVTPPVYYPFFEVIRDNGRRIVECPLPEKNGRYEIDFEAFEKTLRTERPKVFLLCSPHNPVGRVWTAEELRRIVRLCGKYGTLIVSDEIHCDFTLPGHPHTPLLIAAPEAADRAVICTSPSKTFNLAGLQISNIWIPDPELRKAFRHEVAAAGYSQPNLMGIVACEAAYRTGDAWHRENQAYLQQNLAFFREYLREHLPELRLVEPEGTYFAWVDFSGLGLTPASLNDLLIHKAGLWLDSGEIFGAAWAQYQRFVLAAPTAILKETLQRIKHAVEEKDP